MIKSAIIHPEEKPHLKLGTHPIFSDGRAPRKRGRFYLLTKWAEFKEGLEGLGSKKKD
mgnify:CR=1 FL=1